MDDWRPSLRKKSTVAATPLASGVASKPSSRFALLALTETSQSKNESCPGAMSGVNRKVLASGADTVARSPCILAVTRRDGEIEEE